MDPCNSTLNPVRSPLNIKRCIGTLAVLLTLTGCAQLNGSASAPKAVSFESTTITSRPLSSRAQSRRSEPIRLQPTMTPSSTPTRPAPTPTGSPTPIPTATIVPALPGVGPDMAGERIVQASRYDVYLGISSLPAESVLAILPRIDAGLDAAEASLGTRLQARASVAFYRLARRPARGVRAQALTEERRLELFYAPEEDAGGAVRVAIHELAHQLEADRYGGDNQRLADTILHEGLATWLAGDEWLAPTGSASWRERGRDLMDQGRLRAIRSDPSGAAANDAYEGWASFVDYLITTYGWTAFDDLYCSGDGRYPGSADYRLVYDKPLDDLVDEWHGWLQEKG